jgi:ethanolamine ammonia-lyase small subunit
VSDESPVPVESLGSIRTPARILVGRAGTGYRTATWLKLREDHAAARDAVEAPFVLPPALDGVPLVNSRARSKREYLMRPDLGRRFDDESRDRVREFGSPGCELQVVLGDGLSPIAVTANATPLLAELRAIAAARGWPFGRPFAVRYCRVGILNEIGELLNPTAVVLLIGERPGLATAESLSAYLAFRPRVGHTDADRNLISNIHANGVGVAEAVARIAGLIERFRATGRSGVTIKEQFVADSAVLPGEKQ